MYFKLSFKGKNKRQTEYKNFFLINKKFSTHRTFTFQISYFYYYLFCFEFDVSFSGYDSNYLNITLMGYNIRIMTSDDRKVYDFIEKWSE